MSHPPCSGLEGRSKTADERLSMLSSLLNNLDDAAQADGLSHTHASDDHQTQLARVRLGVASSLFTALQARHAPTAAHSLRVALGVSSWALSLDLSEEQRDMIEVAALLHDIGKIGVPDHVLLKPGRLSGEELQVMEQHRRIGREILSGCCASAEVLDVVYYATSWYDGSRYGFDRSGDQLPLGSRMIAIVDAFDAMTTDHVYRRAMSRERAMAELFEFAGTQFHRELVTDFCHLISTDRVQFNARVARRWLRQIQPEASDAFWSLQATCQDDYAEEVHQAFHTRLLESMHDGVVFVDAQLKILLWNRAAERLTGIAASSVLQVQWQPSLVGLRDEHGKPISDSECPVAHTVRSGVQTLRRLSVAGRNQERLSIDVHAAPVFGRDGAACGATLVLHDASSQITLEERVQTLHEKATRDPLTKIANRAEFDRVFPQFVETHLQEGLPCSLIICDLDHFKRINDTHGHQSGDEALVTFASVLQRHSRSGDLVARYGGEEFVVLCADCDNATATRRAEEIRRRLCELPQASLGNESITASFGVTEIQGGDTPETLLRRADRALLQAKDAGRNIVVQLGTGIGREEQTKRRFRWYRWLGGAPAERLLERSLITVVPLRVAAEKLRGFVADHHAEILSIDDNHVTMKVDGQHTPPLRRWNDRPVPLIIELTFDEKEVAVDRRPGANRLHTVIRVAVRPRRERDRRRRDTVEQARQLLVSLKSYLMAHDHTEPPTTVDKPDGRETFLRKAKQILSYWLRK